MSGIAGALLWRSANTKRQALLSEETHVIDDEYSFPVEDDAYVAGQGDRARQEDVDLDSRERADM
jgi:hypothetical protein